MVSDALRSQKYLWAAHAGGVLMAAMGLTFWLDGPDFIKGLFVGMLLAIVAILFRRKLRDEYVETLWNAGTAAAFLLTLVSTVGVELVRGFVDPAVDVFAAAPLFSATEIGVIALATFFIAFHVAMWRSRI